LGGDGIAALCRAARVRAKGYIARLPVIVIQVAPLLFLLKSPQLAIGVTPTNFLTGEFIWGSVSSLNNLAIKSAILKLGNFTAISRGLKT